ncbi:MAG TPA: hypothetical protein VGH80_04475 [Xanthomonadaceae bacterium]|jgi:hypothetical protein
MTPTHATGHPKNVLIDTERSDFHALVVAVALEARGNKVFRRFVSDYPGQASMSFLYGRDRKDFLADYAGTRLRPDEVDVVWNRRPTLPAVPAGIARADAQFVEEELRAAASAFDAFLSHSVWINEKAAAENAELKPVQLREAHRCGLDIPETLISNDPADIRAFVGSRARCVYKPLNAHVWEDGDRRTATYTAAVTLDDLPADALLRAAPGIFQERIGKSFEVRAQFFGRHCAAIKIDTSSLPFGDLDWRSDQGRISSCERIELPRNVYRACCNLMARLGIVSGAFDFIVDESGRWVFLEVNQAGQFLFMEQWCPGLPVLDAFCQFVENVDWSFEYAEPRAPLRVAEILAKPELLKQLECDRRLLQAARAET